MEDETPIYDFAHLKQYLVSKGYTIGTRAAYEIVKPEDVKPEDIVNGTMEFRTDGIFTVTPDGRQHQVFLYKKKYHLGYGKPPRYHICKCSVIEEFIQMGRRDEYVRANTDPVPVIDLDEIDVLYKKKEISHLPLCGYCRRMLSDYGNIDTSQFVELLKAANGGKEKDKEVERDLFGYTRDWDMISKEYREKHDYTCESCGLKIEDDYDKQYMHVHHINGDKLNNDESNLRCLCVYCHAHVDDHHFRRLTRGANKVSYFSFIDRYADEGYWPIDESDLRKARNYMQEILRGRPTINITIENHFDGEIDQLTINSE